MIETESVRYSETDAAKHVISKFEEVYRRPPENVVFTPYRICPIGAHSDHNLGKITGFAIDKGIYIAYAPKMNGVVEIASLQFPKRAQWHVLSTPSEKQNDWADHLRGATIALQSKFPLKEGLCAIIDGELPIGGLSSSAAVIITFLSALAKLNHITLTPQELITISKEAENSYVGVACGKLDQSCEVYCRKDNLLYLDTKDDTFELIPKSANMKPYEIAIFFSGVERSLASSKFNMRVDELRSAAYCLKAFSGMEYGKFRLDFDARFTGSQYQNDPETGKKMKMEAFALFNARFRFQAAQNVELYAGIKNIGDKFYAWTPGYPMPGRTIYAGFTYRF